MIDSLISKLDKARIFSKNVLVWINAEILAIVLYSILLLGKLILPIDRLPASLIVILAFYAVLIFPGFLLTSFLPTFSKIDFLIRLPFSFAFSYALWAIPIFILLRLHSNWPVFIITYLIINIILIVAYINWYLRGQGKVTKQNTKLEPQPKGFSNLPSHILIITIGILLFILIVLIPLSSGGFSDGDVLTHVALIRSVLEEHSFNVAEPLFGLDIPMPTRGSGNPWLLLPAFLSRITNIDPIELLPIYIRPFLAILAILSLYTFVKEFSQNRELALFTAIFLVIYLASEPFHRHGNQSYALFRRIISDKFLLFFIIYPLALVLGRRFLLSGKRYYLLSIGFLGLGIALTHALISLFFFITISIFSLAFTFLLKENRNKKIVIRTIYLIILSAGLMTIPFFQGRSEANRSTYLFLKDFSTVQLEETKSLIAPFFSVSSLGVPGDHIPYLGNINIDNINPFVVRRLYNQVKAQGLIILNSWMYISHPSLLWDVGPIVAFLLTPLLLFWSRRDNLAVYLLATMLIYPIINFNPWIAPIVGRIVTPWQLYRFTWPLPTYIVLAYFLYKVSSGCRYFLLKKYNLIGVSKSVFQQIIIKIAWFLPIISLVILTIVLLPRIQSFSRSLLIERDPTEVFSSELRTYFTESLNGELQDGEKRKILLTDYKSNQYFAGLFNRPDIVAHRYNNTSEQFPGSLQDEALERSLAVDNFTNAKLIDHKILDTIDRFHVDYILVRNDKEIACQFKHMPSFFELLINDDHYALYKARNLDKYNPIILGNNHMGIGEWNEAQKAFNQALELNPSSVISNIGMAEALSHSGTPNLALDYYKTASELSNNDHCIQYALAKGYVNVGNFDQAISILRNTIKDHPNVASLHKLLGDIYILRDQIKLAQYEYLQSLSIETNFNPVWMQGDFEDLGYLESKKIVAGDESLFEDSPEAIAFNELVVNLFKEKGWYEEILQVVKRTRPSNQSPDNNLLIADLLVKVGQTDQALEQYNEVIRQTPLNEEAYLRLGDLFKYLGDYDEALDAYKKSVSISMIKLDWGVDARMRIGSLYKDIGQTDLAVDTYWNISNLIPNLAKPHLEIARIFQIQDKISEAESAYFEAIEINPSDARPYLKRGNMYFKLGDKNDAHELFRLALETEPNSFPALNAIGKYYLDQKEYDDARTAYNRSLIARDANIGAYLGLARVFQKQNLYTAADSNWHQAIIQSPKSSLAFVMLGNDYLKTEQLEIASDFFKRGIAANSNMILNYKQLADVEFLRGNQKESISVLEKAVETNPNSGQAKLDLGNQYRRYGRFADSQTQYENAIQVDPSNIGAYRALAELYLSRDNDERSALELYLSAVKNNPTYGRSFELLGDYLTKKGRYQEALQTYHTGVNYANADESIYIKLNNLYQLLGEWDEAILTLEDGKANVLNSSRIDVHLGDLHLQRGEYGLAKSYYLEAIENDPSEINAYTGLANLNNFEEEGVDRKQEALEILASGIETNTKTASAYISYARFADQIHLFDEAENYFILARELEPNNPIVYTAMGEYYYRRHDDQLAIDILLQGLKIEPNNTSFYILLGDSYSSQGNFEEALNWYNQAMSIDHSDPAPHIAIAKFYSSHARIDQAIDTLEHGLSEFPYEASLHQNLSEYYREIGRFDDAVRQSNAAIKLAPGNASYQLSLGELYISIDQLDSAVSMLEIARSNSPTNQEIYKELSVAYLYSGDLTKAENSLTEGVEKSRDQVSALISRAEFYESHFDWEKARTDFEQVWDLYPTSPIAAKSYAQFLIRRGEFVEALKILNSYTELPLAGAEGNTYIGNVYSARANWEAAENAYLTAIKSDPKYLNAYVKLAQIYQLQGRLGEEIELLEKATEASPVDPLAWIGLGDRFVDQLEFEDAVDAYQKALEVDPQNLAAIVKLEIMDQKVGGVNVVLNPLLQLADNAPSSQVYMTLGSLYQLRRDWTSAQFWYEEAVILEPLNSTAWLALGNFYLASKEWDLSLEALDKALKLANNHVPDIYPVLMTKGRLYENLGRYDEASESNEKAIQLDKSQVSGYIALARLQTTQNKFDLSIETAQTANQLLPGYPVVYSTLGSIYFKTLNEHDARHVYKQGLKVAPGSDVLYASRGWELLDFVLGTDRNLKVNLFNEILAQIPELSQQPHSAVKVRINRTPYLLAGARFSARKLTEEDKQLFLVQAREDFLKALRIRPDNVLALSGLGRLEFYDKNYNKSGEYFQDAVSLNRQSKQAWNALGNYYLLMRDEDRAAESFLSALQISPTDFNAYLGLMTAFRRGIDLDISILANSVTYSQFSWDRLLDLLRLRLP